MKKAVLGSFIALCALFANSANAALITSSDIASVNVTGPADWTFVNINDLFDGIVATDKNSSRFIAYRNGGDEPSSSDPISILVSFNTLFDINGFSFFNDWGNNFAQQVSAITIFGFDANGVLTGSGTFPGLQTGSFSPSTFSGADVSGLKGVQSLSIEITATQGANLEIRELQFDATAVNAPATLGLFGLALGGLLLRRKSK